MVKGNDIDGNSMQRMEVRTSTDHNECDSAPVLSLQMNDGRLEKFFYHSSACSILAITFLALCLAEVLPL